MMGWMAHCGIEVKSSPIVVISLMGGLRSLVVSDQPAFWHCRRGTAYRRKRVNAKSPAIFDRMYWEVRRQITLTDNSDLPPTLASARRPGASKCWHRIKPVPPGPSTI
jgi:hypothetical protein